MEAEEIDELEGDSDLIIPNQVKPIAVKKVRNSRAKSISSTNSTSTTTSTTTPAFKPLKKSSKKVEVRSNSLPSTSTSKFKLKDVNNNNNNNNNASNKNNNVKRQKLTGKVWICPELDENGEPILPSESMKSEELELSVEELEHKPSISNLMTSKNKSKTSSKKKEDSAPPSSMPSSIELPLSLHQSIKNEASSSPPRLLAEIPRRSLSVQKNRSPAGRISTTLESESSVSSKGKGKEMNGEYRSVSIALNEGNDVEEEGDVTMKEPESSKVTNSMLPETEKDNVLDEARAQSSSPALEKIICPPRLPSSLPLHSSNPSLSKRNAPTDNLRSQSNQNDTPLKQPLLPSTSNSNFNSNYQQNQNLLNSIPKPRVVTHQLISLTPNGISTAIESLLSVQNELNKNLEIKLDLTELHLKKKEKINFDLMERIKGFESKIVGLQEVIREGKEDIRKLEERVDVLTEIRIGLLREIEEKEEAFQELKREKQSWGNEKMSLMKSLGIKPEDGEEEDIVNETDDEK